MTKRRQSILLGVLVVAGLAALFTTALTMRPGPTLWWTNGADIRVGAVGAPIRQILWLPATPLAGSENAPADEYEPRFSADGTTMVFVRRRPGTNADLFTSRWTPAGWTVPEPIASINTEYDELGPDLSYDGQSIYFYSDRPGGLGGHDIWRSHKSGSGWGTPTTLGPAINTSWNEYGPALTPDGTRLYFSSNRPRANEPAPRGEPWSATIREQRTRHDYDIYAADLGGSDPVPAAPV